MSRSSAANQATAPRLLGLGTALPDHRVEQADAARLAVGRCGRSPEDVRPLRALYRMTRVARRGSALMNETDSHAPNPADTGNGHPADDAAAIDRLRRFFPEPGDRPAAGSRGPTTAARMQAYSRLAPALARRAAAAALDEASIPAERITHLVTVSCTGFEAPGVDLQLVMQLKLPPNVQRVNVGFMGCHGALNGLATARALAATDPSARVLLCCVELCSLHFQYGWDEQQLVANALFADGAAAAVIGTPADSPASANGPPSPAANWSIIDTASRILPDSTDQMTWRIDDHGFIMSLSPQVPHTLIAHVAPWIGGWLAEHRLSIEEIDGWVVHPGGPRILTATQQALNLPADALALSHHVLREHGNMSSPTVLFILQQLEQQRRPRPRNCVMLSFGPGLTGEAALLQRLS